VVDAEGRKIGERELRVIVDPAGLRFIDASGAAALEDLDQAGDGQDPQHLAPRRGQQQLAPRHAGPGSALVPVHPSVEGAAGSARRYARTADLDQVYEAAGRTLAETDMASLSYQAVKIAHADGGACPPRSARATTFPHLTVGAAKFDDLKIIEAEQFDALTIDPAGLAVYHLGNNGTARELLKARPVTSS
jgi:hypothetical protein